jgi:DNA-binding response OmpR family regulator
VVDDEPNISEVLELYLRRQGYAVEVASDGQRALELAGERPPDLLVLDLMLPVIDGIEVCRRLRAQSDVPIIMLTAKGAEADRLAGLELGADDYVVKPFSPREVVARVKAVLRRATVAPALIDPHAAPLEFPGLRVDARRRSVEVEGRPVALTAKEFDLLWFTAQHPHQVFTRQQLLDAVWGHDFFGDAGTVTVHIRRLRTKIEREPSRPHYLVTVWGVGYRFEVP